MQSISANLNIMIKAAEKASRALIRDFGEIEKLQVSIKGPSDFVSNADLKAEKIIIEELKKARPYYSIISEEDGSEKNKDKNNTWIIDPIDGTTNFLHGIPHFAISIALKSNDEIVSGLIYDPIKDEMFYAEKDNGAFFNNQRIKVSKKNDIEDCLFAIGEKLDIELSIKYRKSGSSALDMAYFASGRYDGYFQQNLKLWNIAAGIILVQEAGGIINDLDLKNYNSLNILSSNSFINEEFKKKINF
jgi:myo-inositol-1(or 4)-monophosphatase